MKYMIICSLIIVIAGCAASPYLETNKVYRRKAAEDARLLRQYPLRDSAGLPYAADWAGTTNFSMRRPNFVIIHHTAQNSCAQTITTFTTEKTAVSAHYVICRDGTVHHMLNDLLRAHHAGVSRWGNNYDINSSSIGIEIDNNGYEPFTREQISSLEILLGRLKRAYNIPQPNFIGHSDVAPGRKVDPSAFFPWDSLATHGYGIWFDTTAVELPADFNALQALRIIGYNIQKPDAAISSFKLHYVPSDTSLPISEPEKKILYSLQQRAL